jgi:hypothetical protein
MRRIPTAVNLGFLDQSQFYIIILIIIMEEIFAFHIICGNNGTLDVKPGVSCAKRNVWAS